MQAADGAIAVGQAVHKNIAAQVHSRISCPGAIRRIGIRDVKRSMELAPGIAAVKNVAALRCSSVSLARLRSHRATAERNFVGLQNTAVARKDQSPLCLQDYNFIRLKLRERRVRPSRDGQQDEQNLQDAR